MIWVTRRSLVRNVTIWLLGLGLVIFGYWETKKFSEWTISNGKQEIGESISVYKNALEMILTRRLSLATGLEKFVVNRNDKEIFRDFPLFASGLQNEFVGVRNVGVAKGGILSLIYPIKGNEQAINYNLLADETPSVKADIAKSIESGNVTVSKPFFLRQGGLAIAARKAIFKNNNLWGFISVVVDVPTAVSYSGINNLSRTVKWALRDGNGVTFWGDEAVFRNEPAIVRIIFDGSYWELGGLPIEGWSGSVLGKVRLFESAWLFLTILVLMLFNYVWTHLPEFSRKKVEWGGVWETAKPALWYLLLGVIWILFSDAILNYLVTDPTLYTEISIAKGWAFVVVTAILLFLWTSQSFEKLGTLLSLLKKAQKVAQLGYYVLDIRTGFWEGSDVLLEMFGIDDSYVTDIEGWLNLIHPDYRRMMKKYFLNDVLGAKKPFDKEYKVVNKRTRKELWVHGKGKLDFDFLGRPIRMIGTIQNINERKKVQEELSSLNYKIRTEKQKLESILQDIGDAVFVTDTEKKIIMTNLVMEKLFGLKEREMIGKNMEEVVRCTYELSGKAPRDLIKKIFEKKNVVRPKETLILKRKGGDSILIDGVASPVEERGKLVGTVWVLRNVTKQRELEKLRSDFVSLASHQLRSPLTGIKWFVELLLEEIAIMKPEKARTYIEKIGESNGRLIELVNDLLTTSRIEEGKTKKTSFREVPFKDILTESLKQEERHVLDQEISIEIQKDIPKNIVVKGDEIQLIQVFSNLIDNAVSYSPKSSKVKIEVQTKQRELVFKIEDTGVGIPQRQQKNVFEKFFRGDNVAKKSMGTGLGLYMTKHIVEEHGGKVWFESTEGKGTTFFVKLPIKQKEDGQQKESDDR